MSTIDLEIWNRSDTDSRRMEYVGQPVAQEVFEELKYRLESTGYLPDEYFLMASEWEKGREIPKDADIFCTTDYGASEGVYLDVYLKWYDKEQNKSITKTFITGKTLGESGNDLDRMFLISSAITKAFHGGDMGVSRFLRADGQESTGDSVFQLSVAEQKTLIGALAEQRERQEAAMTQTEQLLRRMTGSITAYMDTVGQRPLHMSDFDKAVLAIRDGDLEAFKKLLPDLRDRSDELLVKVAERPGIVGRKMTMLMLDEQPAFSQDIYCAACKKAIDIGDIRKVGFLLDQAPTYVEKLPQEFCGDLAHYAYWDHGNITDHIIDRCTAEQVAAFPGRLLYNAVLRDDSTTPWKLVQKGINCDECIVDIIDYCAANRKEAPVWRLLQDGLDQCGEFPRALCLYTVRIYRLRQTAAGERHGL